VKACAYIVMGLLEDDEESQRRGLVVLAYHLYRRENIVPDFDPELQRKMTTLADWLPFRMAGMHLCMDPQFLGFFKSLLVATMSRTLRIRLRFHAGTLKSQTSCSEGESSTQISFSFVGTHQECQYELMTFGVPVQVLPVTYDGELKTTNHLKWIARRKVKDTKMIDKTGVFDGVDLPGRYDVLLGRGRLFQDHPGSVNLRNIVSCLLEVYKLASKRDKKAIAWKVVEAIKGQGGRFLKRNTDDWSVEVSDESAQEKVSTSFRTSLMAARKQVKAVVPEFEEMYNGKRRRMENKSGPCFCL
jgi:hypothetical protein